MNSSVVAYSAVCRLVKTAVPVGWGGLGWGGVGHVNVRLYLRHEARATSRNGFAWTYVMKWMLRQGWGGVGHVNVCLYSRHEVDATSRIGWGGVGWGMLTFA